MYLVGITGLIASGKTSVAKLYKDMGAYLIDADRIGHKLLKEPAIKKRIVDAFGEGVLDGAGEIDRSQLAAVVFSSSENLEKLNSIMEKPLCARIRDIIVDFQKGGFPGVVVLDAALLPRWDLAKAMDLIVIVEAPKWQLMNRLIRQRGLSQEDAERRIQAQEELFKTFHPRHSIIVKNNGDFAELKTNAMQAWLEIKERARAKAHR